MKVPLLYRDQPMFGFDISARSVKVIQLKAAANHRYEVLGYGYAEFPPDTIIEGIIVDPEPILSSLQPLLKQMTYGKITAKRVAISLPVAKVFTRVLQLPPMNDVDLAQAVRFEAEQYIPVPIADLYIDYSVFAPPKAKIKEPVSPDGSEEPKAVTTNVLMVAAPRAIVDSYVSLLDKLGLEVGAVESGLAAVTRALTETNTSGESTLIADIGGKSIDVTIFDQVLRLTNTIALGGDSFTEALVKALQITPEEASEIKFKFGLGPSGLQAQVVPALEPPMNKLVEEIRRVMRFYDEREQGSQPIKTIILTGGTAAMPGLDHFLSQALGKKVLIGDAWSGLVTKHVQAVSKIEAPLYTTAIGLAIIGAHA